MAGAGPFSLPNSGHSSGKYWQERPFSFSEQKGSEVAARVTVVEYFDKLRFDQAGNGIAGCRCG